MASNTVWLDVQTIRRKAKTFERTFLTYFNTNYPAGICKDRGHYIVSGFRSESKAPIALSLRKQGFEPGLFSTLDAYMQKANP